MRFGKYAVHVHRNTNRSLRWRIERNALGNRFTFIWAGPLFVSSQKLLSSKRLP